MIALNSVPTSALLAELNARKQRAPVDVAEINGPTPTSPKKWGVRRDGDVYRTDEGQYRQRYIALCPSVAEAREIARLINEADAQRVLASNA